MTNPRARAADIGWTFASAAVVAVTAFGAAQFRTAAARDRVDHAGLVVMVLTAAAAGWLAYACFRRATWSHRSGVASTTRRTTTAALGPVPPGAEDAALRVERVTVAFGDRLALDDVSLHVRAGEIVGLLGPNGAGKTTTVDVCCGLRSPLEGRAVVLGENPRVDSVAFRRQIGVLPQESGLYPELTGLEHLELFAALYSVPQASTRAAELLRLLDLWERRDSRVSTYSGGMQRRLALARALLHDPPVLFLDEPTLGVDVHGRRALWEHIRRLRDEGRSVLVTTNYLDEAAELCDRVVIMTQGHVVADARPEELRRSSGGSLVLTVDGDPARVADAVRRENRDLDIQVGDAEVRIALDDPARAADVVALARHRGSVVALRTVEPTLEEVFLRLTGRVAE